MTPEELDAIFKNKKQQELNQYFCDDLFYIKNTIHDSFGVILSDEQVIEFWRWESENYCAGWLTVSSKSDIISSFERFCANFS